LLIKAARLAEKQEIQVL